MIKSKIVILGGGFISTNLTRLLDKKHDVIIFTSQECNLLDKSSIVNSLSFLTTNDVIIFSASITRLKENSIISMNNNIKMAQNIADFLSTKRIKQLIYFSSIDVYGTDIDTITESSPLNPNDFYATSKVISEYILKIVCRENNIRLFISRLSGVFGQEDVKKSTLYHLVSSANNTDSITLFNKGKDKRDFISINYLIDIIKNAIDINYDGILNIATGKSYSIANITKIIQNHISKPINILYDSTKTSRDYNINIDIDKLKKSKLSTFVFVLEDEIKQYILTIKDNRLNTRIKDEK